MKAVCQCNTKVEKEHSIKVTVSSSVTRKEMWRPTQRLIHSRHLPQMLVVLSIAWSSWGKWGLCSQTLKTLSEPWEQQVWPQEPRSVFKIQPPVSGLVLIDFSGYSEWLYFPLFCFSSFKSWGRPLWSRKNYLQTSIKMEAFIFAPPLGTLGHGLLYSTGS